jgi:hypothetical protein
MTSRILNHKALALGVITLCTIAYPASAADKLANIHTIGVISSFKETLELNEIGSTIFSNSKNTVSISEWKINELAVQEASSELQSKFSVKPVATDPSTFPEESADIHDWKRKRFVSLPENGDIDAYIIILPSSDPDPLGSGSNLEGLGFLKHGRIFGSSKLALYAIYKVYIIDAKTGSIIDYGSARVPDSAFLGDPSPYAPMQESQWIASASELTEEGKTELKDRFVALIRKSLPYAFYNANLPLNR